MIAIARPDSALVFLIFKTSLSTIAELKKQSKPESQPYRATFILPLCEDGLKNVVNN